MTDTKAIDVTPPPGQQQAAARAERIHGLDFLRGLCAVFVATYHSLLWIGYGDIDSMGTFPVYTFFVLSALTIAHIYYHDFKDVVGKDKLKDFLFKRIMRVLPLLAVVSLVMALLRVAAYQSLDLDILTRFLMTATGAFALHMPAMMSNTVGAWSLGVEFVFYISFPLLALLMPARIGRGLIAVFVFLLVMQQLAIHKSNGFEAEYRWFSFVMPLTFAPFFLGGLMIYLTERKTSLLALLLATLCLCVMSFYSVFFPGPVGEQPLVFLALTGLSIAAVYFSYNSAVSGGLAWISHELGRLSYPLYLTHWFSFQAVSKLGGMLGLDVLSIWALFMVVALVVAHFANILLEVPMQRVLRRYSPSRRLDRAGRG